VWARERIVEVLRATPPMDPAGAGAGYTISVKDVTCEGDAQVTVNRGKRKYICDFTVTVTWTAVAAGGAGGEVEGQLVVNDVTAEKDYEYEVQYPASSSVFTQAARTALKGPMEKLKAVVAAQLETFFAEYTTK
jgi:activator of HSP90 ATPase